MIFRNTKKLFVYFDEYSCFHVNCTELLVNDNKVRFFKNKSEVADIPLYNLHHVEYYNSIFDTETVYISKTEIVRKEVLV